MLEGSTMAASDGLSDAEWVIWEPFFPPERGRAGQPAKVSTRTFLNALLWMTGEGARWRALPERFGAWNTVWRRFARWRDQGVWQPSRPWPKPGWCKSASRCSTRR
jgi:transposase